MSVYIHVDDGTLIRHEPEEACPSNTSPPRMQNACGTVIVEDRYPTHCAWMKDTSIFGVVRKAYTAAGNLVLQQNKASFKGAVSSEELRHVMKELVWGDFTVRLQLVVLSAGVGRCLDVRPHCLLEQRLYRVPWVYVMGRLEEICNVVVFYVLDWRKMEEALGLRPRAEVPKSTTVSVTRRGTMTMRLTWAGIDWGGNGEFEEATDAMARYVRELI